MNLFESSGREITYPRFDMNAALDSDDSFSDCNFKWPGLWFQYCVISVLNLLLPETMSETKFLIPPAAFLSITTIVLSLCFYLLVLWLLTKLIYLENLVLSLHPVTLLCRYQLSSLSLNLFSSLFFFPPLSVCLYCFMLSLFLTWVVELSFLFLISFTA